jgi:hypothetical protein
MDRTNLNPGDHHPTSLAETHRIAQTSRSAAARNASGRRRPIDPTTCSRDYSAGELEFMAAMHDYKMSSGRMFPTLSEVLEVVCGLGYAKAAGG